MKREIFKITLVSIFALVFVACGSQESESEEASPFAQNRTINPSQSIICSDKATFSVAPSEQAPDVTITSDVASGDTTIAVDSTSQGYVVVSNCVR